MQQTSEVSGDATWKYRCWLYRSKKQNSPQRAKRRGQPYLCVDVSRPPLLLLLLMVMVMEVKITVRRRRRDWRAVAAAAVLPLVGRSGGGRGGAGSVNHAFSLGSHTILRSFTAAQPLQQPDSLNSRTTWLTLPRAGPLQFINLFSSRCLTKFLFIANKKMCAEYVFFCFTTKFYWVI